MRRYIKKRQNTDCQDGNSRYVKIWGPRCQNRHRYFNKYESILQSPDIEAVIIATGHSVSQHVEQAAAAGNMFSVKTVYSDKKECNCRCKRARTQAFGLRLLLMKVSTPLIRIKEMIENGALSTVLHVEGAHSGHAGYDQLEGWRSTREESAGVM